MDIFAQLIAKEVAALSGRPRLGGNDIERENAYCHGAWTSSRVANPEKYPVASAKSRSASDARGMIFAREHADFGLISSFRPRA
ncbi:hypothetical protein [Trinickia mobilis]|uniref:hypothetical protein n=1 Tax=Trinickia mobilis TaxID=2816356 RepID=UPI001A8DEAFC|nr:hypothetical protein [Trinickia mobilis]